MMELQIIHTINPNWHIYDITTFNTFKNLSMYFKLINLKSQPQFDLLEIEK